MATLTAVIQKKSIRADNTWNVKIKIAHKSKERFLDTGTFVTKRHLDKDFRIKDPSVFSEVLPDLNLYNQMLDKLGTDVNQMSPDELKVYLNTPQKMQDNGTIDFKAFCAQHIDKLISHGKLGSAKNMKRVANSLNDYFGTPTIPITNINYAFLVEYEAYLQTTRRVTRLNSDGGERLVLLKPNNEAGLHTIMRDLRGLFNAARTRYNDEDTNTIRIAHYPFKKYKVGPAPLTEHRNLSVEEITRIRDLKVITKDQALTPPKNIPFIIKGSRAELARDLCILSFYLLGMNAADMYELQEKIGPRIGYNRAKTRGKRKDKAFISIKVIDEAKPLLKRYAGKLQKRYSLMSGLNAAIDKGLQEISKQTGITDLDFYSMRHSVGTLSRNVCGFSYEDTAIALNQKERSVTDIYIEPDWSTVDKVQEAVTSLLLRPSISIKKALSLEKSVPYPSKKNDSAYNSKAPEYN